MLEKIKNLKWHFHLMMLVSRRRAGLREASGTSSQAKREPRSQCLNDEISQLQAKNETARVATQRINEFRALYASKAEEYEELKVLLPEQREITNVLAGLQDTANSSRMMVDAV